MKTVAFVATKGGVGKSTMAECITAQAIDAGRSVYLADMDPQKSFSDWWYARGEPNNPRLIENVDMVSAAVKLIVEKDVARDLFIVDTPGSLIPVIRDAIEAADCVVVPLQPSPKDLLAQEAVNDLITAAKKWDKTVLVVNRSMGASTMTPQAVELIKGKTKVKPLIVSNRVDYQKAPINGQTAPEINSTAAAEINFIWKAIAKIAGVKAK